MDQGQFKSELMGLPFIEACKYYLKKIAIVSTIQQAELRAKRNLAKLVDKYKQVELDQALLASLVLDYLRKRKYNYSCSMLMREADILSYYVLTEGKLAELSGLKAEICKQKYFRASILEVILSKFVDTLAAEKVTCDFGVQFYGDNQNNLISNKVVMENRISEIRMEVEQRYKKHYEKLLKSLYEQQMFSARQYVKEEHKAQITAIRAEYDARLKQAKDNEAKLSLIPNLYRKISDNEAKIVKLNAKISELSQVNKNLEGFKLSHNCLQNYEVIRREEEVKKYRAYLYKKKLELEFALRSMGTKVEDLMQQKMALRDKKPTDAYIEDKKIERANKEHAIDEIYSKLTAMEKRVQTLSMDNEALREEAKQLRLKNKEMRLQKEAEETAKDENKEIHKQKKMYSFKAQPINVSVGVIDSDLTGYRVDNIPQNVEVAEDFEEDIDLKAAHRRSVNYIQSQMKLIKNRVRIFVQYLY